MAICMYSCTFEGDLEDGRQDAWGVFLCGVDLVGGLALMFASSQLGRSVERTSPNLRRYLYGYNAVLTGLLLLSILAVANVLTYVKWGPFGLLGQRWDWTASR